MSHYKDLKPTKIHGDALLAITRLEAQLATLQKERDEALSKLGCYHLDAPYRRVLQERDEALEKLDAIKKVLESGGKP